MTRNRLAAALLALTLVAAGCGGDDDPSTEGTTTPADDPPTTSAETTSPTTSTDAANGTSEAPDPTEPVELTDSFRGVTADTIKIGVVYVDVSVVGRNNGDVQAQWQAAIDAVNDNGGVLGRNLEPIFAPYSPLGDTETEAACVELTQNQQVFAAMGPLLSNISCFTDVNDTIFINTFGVGQEEFDQAQAVAIGPGALPARSVDLNASSLTDAGLLDNPIALHAAADTGDELELWKDALTDAGADVVTETRSTIGNEDPAGSEIEMTTFAQVWESAGAETVLSIGAGSGLNVVAGIDRGNFRPQLIVTNSSDFDPNLYRDLGYTTDALEGAVAVGFRDFQDLATTGEAGVGDCIARAEAATGETVNIDPEGDDAVNLNTTIWSCQAIDIFSQIAAAAGADLTNDSFRQAAETLGPLTVTAVENASIGAGKFDIGDTPPLLLIYDAGADDFVPLDD